VRRAKPILGIAAGRGQLATLFVKGQVVRVVPRVGDGLAALIDEAEHIIAEGIEARSQPPTRTRAALAEAARDETAPDPWAYASTSLGREGVEDPRDRGVSRA